MYIMDVVKYDNMIYSYYTYICINLETLYCQVSLLWVCKWTWCRTF